MLTENDWDVEEISQSPAQLVTPVCSPSTPPPKSPVSVEMDSDDEYDPYRSESDSEDSDMEFDNSQSVGLIADVC